MDPELDDLELEGSKPSRMPMIIAAVVALVLGGGIGAGAMMFLGGGDDEGGTEAETADAAPLATDEGSGEAEEAKHTVKVVSLGSFPVNLRGAGGGRVLRIEVQAQVHEENAIFLEPKGDYRPAAQDAILMLASDYTYADLEGIEGKTRLRDEMLGRLNSVVSPEGFHIHRIYFTQFVVQ